MPYFLIKTDYSFVLLIYQVFSNFYGKIPHVGVVPRYYYTSLLLSIFMGSM